MTEKAKVAKFERFDNNGLELIIDILSGEVYASQSAVARMCEKGESTIRAWITSQNIEVKSSQIPTVTGLKTSQLLDEEGIFQALAKYNPELLTKCAKAGLRLYLHGLAGYTYEVTLPKITQPPTALELARENVKLAHLNLALLEEAELLKESLDGYRNLFSGNSTLSMKQASDAFNIPTLGQNNLIKYLRKKGMMCSKGSSPTQVAKDRGYLEIEPSEWEHNGKTYSSQKGVLTWKGFCWLVTQLRTDGYSIRQSPQSMWDIYYPPTNNQLASGN